MKYLRVTMPDGSKWDVPLALIRERTGSDAIIDHRILVDRAENDMNWSDVEAAAVKAKDGTVDYQDGWVNGRKEIIEK